MLLNHLRERVRETNNDESFCPDCGSKLIARRGEIIVWHWAHSPGSSKHANCEHKETNWHLRMKDAYHGFQNWQIEYPVEVLGMRFRLDAVNPKTMEVREFVHSLSPRYILKHRALKAKKFNVVWILDGDEFCSKKFRYTRKINGRVGVKRLLKPIAFNFHSYIPCLVHFQDKLWHEWKNNIWFPNDGHAALQVISNYNASQVANG